jgi:L-threonylcarbamoyladenylate synthase
MNEDIVKCTDVLNSGGVILYPTDTIWGLGCDVSNRSAVEKLLRLKNIQSQSRSLIILVNSMEMLKDYVEEIHNFVYDLIEKAPRPLTVIYPKAKSFAKNIAAQDGSVGIRVVKHKFCCEVIEKLGRPITSTSANITGDASPASFDDVNEVIKNTVDFVAPVKYDEHNDVKASQIIKIDESGFFTVVRK